MTTNSEMLKATSGRDTDDAECSPGCRAVVVRWLPVGDGLPNTCMRVTGFTPVLVVNDHNVQWALFNKKTKDFQDASFRTITRQVTHWMYLPKAPNA